MGLVQRVVLVLVASAGVVSGGRGAARAEDDAAAIAHVKAAKRASENGDHGKAVQEYEAAFKLVPNPSLLIALALSYRELGDVAQARERIERFLREAPADHNRRAEAESLLAELSAKKGGEGESEAAAGEFTPETISLQLEDPEAAADDKARGPKRAVGGLGLPTQEDLVAPSSGPIGDVPFYRGWWFWTATAVIVGGTIAAGVILSQPTPQPGRACPDEFRNRCYGAGRE